MFNTTKAITSFICITFALSSIILGCSSVTTHETSVPQTVTPIQTPPEIADKPEVDPENQTPSITNNPSETIEVTEQPCAKHQIKVEVHPSGAGIVTTELAGDIFNDGTEVNLLTTAGNGFSLDHWLVDGKVAGNITSIMLTSDKVVDVNFVPNVEKLSSHIVSDYMDKQDDIVLVDVRSVADYEKDHIPRAISIPSDEIESRWNEIPQDKMVFVYASCVK